MTLLSPLALVWLASLPVLLWLWRLSTSRHQTRVPSLIPFEHLLRRQAKRRTHLVVNLLFWLQVAALLGLALALTQPVFFQRHPKVMLIVLDTSASMDARLQGPSSFERAQQAVLSRLARNAPTEQVFVVTTAPIAALTPAPTSDLSLVRRALQDLRVSHLGGNLSTTVRIARALLGSDPDDTVIVTDEPPPPEPLGAHVHWVTAGTPMPNVAITGLDARGPLCDPSEAHVMVTIQNFSNDPTPVTITVLQDRQRLAEAKETLAPHARATVSLALPSHAQGWLEIVLDAPHDALAVDNRAWIRLSQADLLPIAVHGQSPLFAQTISTWLDACQALTRTGSGPPSHGSYLVVTDHEEPLPPSAVGVLTFLPPASGVGSPAQARVSVLSHWVASADHPISSYLAPVEVVSAALNLIGGQTVQGIPVISALVQGRKVPVVVADQQEGRRVVSMCLDPVGSEDSTPVLLAFFNSLQWLMSRGDGTTVGEPLTMTGFNPGTARVHRPDGVTEMVQLEGSVLHYDATTQAGAYRVKQGTVEQTVMVNFSDPLESNLMERSSTWRETQDHAESTRPARPASVPLSHTMIWLILALMVLEWWRYSAKRRTSLTASPRPAGPS